MTKLILASTSPYRQQILTQAGLDFSAIAPLCDEEKLKDPSLSAIALTAKLAKHKAESLKNQFPNDIIIGSDQVLEFEGKIFGKSHNRQNAIAQLQSLNGKTHTLVTSLFMRGPDKKEFAHTDITHLKMRTLTNNEIESYIDCEQPFDCAGSYKIEKRGISLFESIETQDFHSIQGLPIISVLSTIKSWGKSFWKNPLDYKTAMLNSALLAQKNSYAPYSTKHIASSILWSDGAITSGCNVENASYGATVCAERVAIWKGISTNKNRLIKAVLVLSDATPPWPPCGMCRQVISEFAASDLKILMVNNKNEWLEYPWKEVFPMGFTPDHLSISN
jgi:septum formation protein